MEKVKRNYPSVSVFAEGSKSNPEKSLPLNEVLDRIKNCANKIKIDKCRKFVAQGNMVEYDKLKDSLPSFTPSGTFAPTRAIANLENYSSFIVLDIDKLTFDQVPIMKYNIGRLPLTFCCFISPSGTGLKVLVITSSTASQHKLAYNQIKEIYERKLGITIDKSGKDVSRLCYYTCDDNLILNEDSIIFTITEEIELEMTTNKTPTEPNEKPNNNVFDFCVQLTEKHYQYTEGSRNSFVHLLACNLNRYGIAEAEATPQIKTLYNYKDDEVSKTIDSAFKNHTHEFNTLQSLQSLQTLQETKPEEDFLKNTPTIPPELYAVLPDILKRGSSVFSEPREKDVFLISALSILSGCLPKVKGIYAGMEVFPNLFSFVIAPAASGKGALTFAKNLADEYHLTILKESNDSKKQYDIDLSEHKQKLHSKGKKDKTIEEEPAKPDFKVLYIPANTSYAKILTHLQQNEGFGIICETEADTLANVFKQDWGGYSDMLRKAFHHEKISSSKKTNNEFIEVNKPCLSIALSGTPNQLTGLFLSSEDGLFSRFLFYAFKVEQEWKDVSPKAHKTNLTEYFTILSKEVFKMVQFLQSEETIVELSQANWDKLNSYCDESLKDVTTFKSEEAGSIVKRLGLILYRITMLLTAMRKFENGESTRTAICTDEDFNTALTLIKIFLQHSILMFDNLPKQKDIKSFTKNDSKLKFIDALPNEFTRKQAVEIGIKQTLSESTVSHWLRTFLEKYLTQPKAGYYKKM